MAEARRKFDEDFKIGAVRIERPSRLSGRTQVGAWTGACRVDAARAAAQLRVSAGRQRCVDRGDIPACRPPQHSGHGAGVPAPVAPGDAARRGRDERHFQGRVVSRSHALSHAVAADRPVSGLEARICWVELRGFEPLTPSMRTRCATGLRHSPKQLSAPDVRNRVTRLAGARRVSWLVAGRCARARTPRRGR